MNTSPLTQRGRLLLAQMQSGFPLEWVEGGGHALHVGDKFQFVHGATVNSMCKRGLVAPIHPRRGTRITYRLTPAGRRYEL